jgi:hypothetical protein
VADVEDRVDVRFSGSPLQGRVRFSEDFRLLSKPYSIDELSRVLREAFKADF